jgi:hypothetical protein
MGAAKILKVLDVEAFEKARVSCWKVILPHTESLLSDGKWVSVHGAPTAG